MVHDHNHDQHKVGDNEHIVGGAKNDVLIGNATNSTLVGGDGNDVLMGDGRDTLGGVGTISTYAHTDGRYGYTNTEATKLGEWDTPQGYSVLDETVFGLPDTGRG